MENERREKIVTLTCTRIKNDMIRKWGNYNYTKYTDSNQREFSPGQDYTRLPELFWLSWIKLTLKMGQVSQLEIVARSDWRWLIFCYLLSHTVITASAVKFCIVQRIFQSEIIIKHSLLEISPPAAILPSGSSATENNDIQ